MLTNARIGERDTIDVAHGYDGDVKEKWQINILVVKIQALVIKKGWCPTGVHGSPL